VARRYAKEDECSNRLISCGYLKVWFISHVRRLLFHDEQNLKELFFHDEQNLNELFAAESSCAIARKLVKSLIHWTHDHSMDAKLAFKCVPILFRMYCDLRCGCGASFSDRRGETRLGARP
jgi:hypothetical protein